MKGKILLILLAFLLAIGLVITSCAKPTPAPAPAPAPAKPEKAFRWRFAMYNPSFNSTHGRAYTRLAKAVFERSGGRLLIDIYPGGTLGYSVFKHHEVVGEGLVEIGDTTAGAVVGVPPFEIFGQVMLYLNMEDAMKAWDAIKPDIEKAGAKFNVLPLLPTAKPNDVLHSTKRPFPTVESLKGAKIRSWAALISDWLGEVGAVPLVIPYPERYTALATGIVEGNFASPESQIDTKDYEVAKYTNLWPLTVPLYWVAVNPAAFNELSPDLQKILLEEVDKAKDLWFKENVGSAEPALKKLEGFGVTIVRISPEEINKAQKAAQAVWKKWVGKVGPEARDVFDKVLKAMGYPPLPL